MVGMSTAIEAIAAKHMGMKIGGIFCISNMASGMQKQERKWRDNLAALIREVVKYFGGDKRNEDKNL